MFRTEQIAEQIKYGTVLNNTKTDIDFIINEKNNKGCIIDSENITEKVNKCMIILDNDKISDISKIKIADFICTKLYKLYFLSIEKSQKISYVISEIVYKNETMIPSLRLYYLKFLNDKISFNISNTVFLKGIKNKISLISYFQILKHLLKSVYTEITQKNNILNEFEHIFNNPLTTLYSKMEIADIFILNNRRHRGYEMLNIIRREELFLNNQILEEEENKINNKTFYQDSQNVHNSDLNESVLKVCVNIILLEQETQFNPKEVKKILFDIFPSETKIIEKVIERIEIDTTEFKFKNDKFNLYVLFSSLWSYINKHQYKNELYKRLGEEFISMSLYCSTGHLSRLINTIQGYTTNDDLVIKISDKDQIKSVINTYLEKQFLNASDKVTDSILDEDKTPFYDFIVNQINKNILHIKKEYGEVNEHIINAIEQYTQKSGWIIENDKLKLQ